MDTTGILCIGALNFDTVAIGTVPQQVIDAVSAEGPFTPYGEMVVSNSLADLIERAISEGEFEAMRQLGGSAFNVMRVLLPFAQHLRLGYVGVGGVVDGSHPHVGFLDGSGVETNFIELSPAPAARSLAFAADGDRTLFTSKGANVEAAEVFQRHRVSLVPYIASFDLVHVSSFLDEETPDVLADLLSSALELNDALVVSVDPGHDWSSAPSRGVERVLGNATILHLNATEFSLLGGRVGNESDDRVAVRVKSLMRNDGSRRLVVRRHDSAVLYIEDDSGRSFRAELPNQNVTPADEVVDATGAGDSFTGGLLAVLASPVLQSVIGVRVGAQVAAAKVRRPGALKTDVAQDAFEAVLGSLPRVEEAQE